ncbi:MAG: hypothetical protein OHK0040_12560 [bacterium]
METANNNREINLNIIFYLNTFLFISGLAAVAVIQYSLINLLSFFLGACLVTLNLYWLKRLATKLIQEGTVKKTIAIEWGAKILFVFGAVAIIILKFKINILIFLFGLSILPIAVLLSSIVLYFKR